MFWIRACSFPTPTPRSSEAGTPQTRCLSFAKFQCKRTRKTVIAVCVSDVIPAFPFVFVVLTAAVLKRSSPDRWRRVGGEWTEEKETRSRGKHVASYDRLSHARARAHGCVCVCVIFVGRRPRGTENLTVIAVTAATVRV